jgi:hypothetical protein
MTQEYLRGSAYSTAYLMQTDYRNYDVNPGSFLSLLIGEDWATFAGTHYKSSYKNSDHDESLHSLGNLQWSSSSCSSHNCSDNVAARPQNQLLRSHNRSKVAACIFAALMNTHALAIFRLP